MKRIDRIYINGQFIRPNGTEEMDLVNPSTKEVIGRVVLGNEEDVRHAVTAAKEAYRTLSQTTVKERAVMLQRLHDAVLARKDELAAANIDEYGAPRQAAIWRIPLAANNFLDAKEALESFEFVRYIGKAKVVLEPVGIVGIITPWNASYSQITGKLAAAIAAGCPAIIKPSEMSAIQTQILTECFHEAGLPAGVINVVNGLGATVGAEMTRHPDIALISFTGSTRTGKEIYRGAAETMKRVTLELGGKSPTLILDDADFAEAVPAAVKSCFGNNGQSCVAGTRLLVPEHRLEEVKRLAKQAAESMKVGDPLNDDTVLGPIVSERQYEHVQRLIRFGIEEGAELVTGGEGHPEGLETGYFVQPTVFAGVTEAMRIAQEEIFGPVLSIMTYRTEDEAVEIANNTPYGLAAYISSSDAEKAGRLASQIKAGVILINGAGFEMKAPFGGFKQSGIGREYGVFGLEECLETKTVTGWESAVK
ncbi:aldehyde dehydrogenase family protein [Paenibacillus humicola]|uniref:aldehyde dehydrogenase family protein n=1 Tax=Paenibacillus humicola TaxID=3110540 RepID=UPI00237B2882|nr:aldehyde dehydrogenase family protein [Paenibacillus humicola]